MITKRIKHNLYGRHSVLKMGIIALAIIAALLVVPGEHSENYTSAAPVVPDHTFNVGTLPGGTLPTGVTWTAGTNTLAFSSAATDIYRLTGARPTLNITVNSGSGNTTKLMLDGLTMTTGSITVTGNLALYLQNSSTINGNIAVTAGNSIIIDSAADPGTGSTSGALIVTVQGNSANAAIGGITTNATTRNAGNITINGGTVTATGGSPTANNVGGGGAGIGGAGSNNAAAGNGGTTTINGGRVTATGGNGFGSTGNNGGAGAGIGGGAATGNGYTGGAGGTIRIEGADTVVIARGGTNTGNTQLAGAGIGGGASGGNANNIGGAGGDVTIDGAYVETYGGSRTTSTGATTYELGGAGIGGGASTGWGGAGANVTISGDAVVKAYGGKVTLGVNVTNAEGGAAIGGGCGGLVGGGNTGQGGAPGGTVLIRGNAVVEAHGGDVVTATTFQLTVTSYIRAGTGIGGGNSSGGNKGGPGGNITIQDNATVTAIGGKAQINSVAQTILNQYYVRAATGIGGGTGAPGGNNGSITITGGKVVAIGGDAIQDNNNPVSCFTRVSAGTGIGAGSGSHTEGGFGDGGTITITGGTVVATGGKYTVAASTADESQHGAGIGGGGQNYANQPGTIGSNAIITLGHEANITAFAYGDDRPAIHGDITTTAVGYVNARLADRAASAISPSHIAILLCEIQTLNVDSTVLDILSTLEYTDRGGYRSFAFQHANSPAGAGYNIYIVGPDGAARLGRVNPDSTVIPTVSGNGGYGTYGNDTNYKGAAPVYIPPERLPAVWERHIDESYLPVIEELKDSSGKILKENRFVIVLSDPDDPSEPGWYVAEKPFIDGHIYEGYFMTINARPSSLNDFVQGYPPRIDPVLGLNTIFFAYTKSPYWVDIDLADGDGSLTDSTKSSYYSYDPSTGTLTIIQDAPTTPGTPLAYRLWQSDTSLVDTIVVRGISTHITVDGITVGDMTLDNAADVDLHVRKGSTFNGGIRAPAGTSLTIDRAVLAGLLINYTLTVAADPDKAGIGGGNGEAAGRITIDGGNVIATGGAGGAGIGGGNGGNGGTIVINGGNVIATGGAGGAGIGGGNGGNGGTIILNGGVTNSFGSSAGGAGIGGGDGGAGAALTLNKGAEVLAFSLSPVSSKAAIDAASVSGDGYYVNAFFVAGSDVPDAMHIYESGALVGAIEDMPTSLRGFAFHLKDAGPSTYTITGQKGSTIFMPVRHDDEGDTNIVSINNPNGYAGHNPLNGSLPVGFGYYVTEYYVMEDGSSISFMSATKTFVATGSYGKPVPDLTSYGYGALGHNWTVAPTGSGTYLTVVIVPAELITADTEIYFVYGPTPYMEIDLFNSDTSLFGTVADVWSDYYEYVGASTPGGGSFLVIKQDAPDGKQYRIYMTGTGNNHYVDGIVVNAGTATTIIIDGIELLGNIELKSSTDVNLLLSGASEITGSIRVPYGAGASNAAITIDSAAGTGSTAGSLTVTASPYDAGIGGWSAAVDAGSITIIGGSVTATGGTTGAGIGGGGGSGANAGGAGGTIVITGGIVTAYGLNGPAIGGGNAEGSSSPGAAATITIGSAAVVEAYSDYYADGTIQGRLPAIYAGNNLGDGFYVNAMLENEISATAPMALEVYDENDVLLTTLTIPAGYRSFAFQLSGSSTTADYYIFAYDGTERTPVLRLSDLEEEIFSINQITGYDGYDNFLGALPVTLRPKWNVTFDTDYGMPVPPVQVVLHGQLVTEPSPPTKEYYLFDGWYSDSSLSTAWDFGTDVVTSDITLYAKWEMDPTMWFSVTLDTNLTDGNIQWSLTGSGSDWSDFTNDAGTYKEWFKISNVSGSPTLVYLLATADTGKSFLRWSSGIPFYASNPYTYNGESDITAGAEFTGSEWIEVTLAASPAGAAGASLTFNITRTPAGSATPVTTAGDFSVTGPFRVGLDETLDFTAGSVTGYEFFQWQDDRSPVNTVPSTGSTGNPDLSSYTGTGSVTFTAIYYDTDNQTLVTLQADPGILSPAFTVVQGMSPAIYNQVGNTRVFVVDKGVPFDATAPLTFAVSITVTYTLLGWAGEEIGDNILNATISDPQTFYAIYYDMETQVLVTLNSFPTSLDPAFTVSQNGADLLFVLPSSGTGRIFAVQKNADFEMTVPSVAGYTFQFWLDGDSITDDNPRTIAANTLTANTTYTAYFTSGADHTLTISVVDPSAPADAKVSVTLEGFHIADVAPGASFTLTVGDGAAIDLLATNGTVSLLSHWSVTGTVPAGVTAVSASMSFAMNDDYDLTANFYDPTDPSTFRTLALDVNNTALGSIDLTIGGLSAPITSYSYNRTLAVGAAIDITAVPATGMLFSNWGTAIGADVPAPFVGLALNNAFALNGNYDLTANFYDPSDPSTFRTLTLGVNNALLGSIDLVIDGLPAVITSYSYNRTLAVGAAIEVEAVPAAGMLFSHWSANGTEVPSTMYSDEQSGAFALNGNYDLTANFYDPTDPSTHRTLDLDVNDDTLGSIDLTIGGLPSVITSYPNTWTLAAGAAIEIEAVPAAGMSFSHWGTVAGADVPAAFDGTALNNAFALNGNYDLTAFFYDPTDPSTHRTLDLDVNDDTLGSIALVIDRLPAVITSYPYARILVVGAAIEIEAVPAAGMSFSNWESGAATAPAGFSALLASNSFAMNADYDLTAVFFDPSVPGSNYTLDLKVTGTGTIDLTVGAVTETVAVPFSHIFATGTSVTVAASATAPWVFSHWLATGAAPAGFSALLASNSFAMNADYDLTAVFEQPIPIPKYFYITANADSRTTISPQGVVSVLSGTNRTFTFSAADGYTVLAVVVDGSPLSAGQIASGSYTFYEVRANHSINVVSRELRTDITLRIDIKEGKGYAEYSVNGGAHEKYTAVVTLPEFCSLDVWAFAEDGYSFSKWVDGSRVYTNSTVPFNDVGAAIQLELYFTDDSGFPWWIIILLLLILLIFLIWFLFFYRKMLSVVKVESSASIIGKDRVRRKAAYSFRIEGGTGTVAYRIGEDGMWKTLLPGPGGEYAIPRGEITDTLIIECR
ncbi:MAG: InlB B-repeat-containing protein [Candidatus Methanoplasma sp.]|jgi:uncharacterized repeat protein (TIGR02543 family)|nr:InlB B-repeat-containing protein [Candidatus Methanoplasma sp.]